MKTREAVFEELVQGLDRSIPCLMHEVLGSGEPCGMRAGRVIFWRNPCKAGYKVEPPYATALCRSHSLELIRGFEDGVFECEGCDQRIMNAEHAIKRIEDL